MNDAEYVRQTLTEVRPGLEPNGVELEMENEPPSTQQLLDPTRMGHVFRNILNNAGDVMPGGGTVRTRFRAEPGMVVTEIEDGGPGIKPEIAPQLFEAFATYGKERGAGLGLSICERIIHSHSVTITAFNSPKGGAVFSFSLPIPRGRASSATPAQS